MHTDSISMHPLIQIQLGALKEYEHINHAALIKATIDSAVTG